ncbi:MAG: tetratricopeptide repeat protein [Bacteroidales bacterium]
MMIKSCKILIVLSLLCLSYGSICSQTVKTDTLEKRILQISEKKPPLSKDASNLMISRFIGKLTSYYPSKASLFLYKTGILLSSNHHNAPALKCFKASFNLTSKNKNSKEYILCALAITDIFYKAMKADSAGYYNDLAYGVSQKNKFDEYEARIYNNKARIADISGQRLMAIDWYLKAAAIHRQSKDSLSLGIVLDNIGTLHLNLKNYNEALKYLRESEIYNGHQKNESYLNDTYGNLAMVYKKLNKSTEAFRYYHKCIVLSKKSGNDFQLARVYMNISNAFLEDKKSLEAEVYLDSCKFICEKNNFEVGLLLYKINKGQLNLEKGEIRKSIDLLQSAEKEMAGNSMPEIQSGLWEIISSAYEKDKQYQLALDYYKKFIALKDSIAGGETNRYVFELQTRYESEHSARQIEQLQQNIEKQKARIGYVLMGLGMSLIIILLLFVMLIIYRRSQQYKHRLAQEENEKLQMYMDVKDQELASKALNMSKINQMVLDVSEQLKKVLPGLTKEKTELLQQLLKDLEGSLPTEAWKEFETRFEQVHKGFYDNLLNLYPELSPTELKVCGFLRLNLTTKDIALLTNRGIGTIEHSRSSIRRKMNLENDANLTSYLLSL